MTALVRDGIDRAERQESHHDNTGTGGIQQVQLLAREEGADRPEHPETVNSKPWSGQTGRTVVDLISSIDSSAVTLKIVTFEIRA